MSDRDRWRDLLDWLAELKDELAHRRRKLRDYLQRNRQRLEAREEANFLRQLSLMIASGIPFTDAFPVLQQSMQGRGAELARDLGNALYQGHSLSRAFHLFAPKVSEVTPPLVEAGESCGGLTRTLQIAADWAELASDLRSKLVTAMIYPLFVLVVNTILAAAMLGFVFPAFLPLFQGEPLPLLTQFFLLCSRLAGSPLFWVLAMLGAIEALLFFSQPEHQVKLHRFGLAVPVVNSLLRSAARTRFCSVLSITTRTGLPLMKALSLAAKASGDPHFLELDEPLQREVREGVPLSEHFLEHSEVYGLVLSHGMALCQETGNTDTVCGHLVTLFQSETEVRVQQLQAMLEPLLIAMVSVTTGTLLLSIYWPLGKFLQTLLG